jgi:hypothetical protein
MPNQKVNFGSGLRNGHQFQASIGRAALSTSTLVFTAGAQYAPADAS